MGQGYFILIGLELFYFNCCGYLVLSCELRFFILIGLSVLILGFIQILSGGPMGFLGEEVLKNIFKGKKNNVFRTEPVIEPKKLPVCGSLVGLRSN